MDTESVRCLYCKTKRISSVDSSDCKKCQWTCPTCVPTIEKFLQSDKEDTLAKTRHSPCEIEGLTQLAHIDKYRQLDFEDMADILPALNLWVTKYIELGIQLHISSGSLARIDCDEKNSPAKMRYVISEWLKQNYNWKNYGLPNLNMLEKVIKKMNSSL